MGSLGGLLVDTQTQPRRAVSAQLDADVTEIHLRAGAGEGVRWSIVVAADDPLVVAARGDRARAMRLVRGLARAGRPRVRGARGTELRADRYLVNHTVDVRCL